LTPSRQNILVLSCEHGGNEVPPAYAALFHGHEALLDSHRGWDPGALELGQQMASACGVPLYASRTTRLLVELNRSLGHRQLFSAVTRPLAPALRREIVDRHYRPHRDAIESAVAGHIAAGRRVLHIASHSFTPMLDGVARSADLAWLYDPARAGEAGFAASWMKDFAPRAPGLRLRRNYPYQGRSDGLMSLLRRHHTDAQYRGIELEVNQRFVAQGGDAWTALRQQLVASLVASLDGA
jgi:predicted N-formylglutamate amidohydrolase